MNSDNVGDVSPISRKENLDIYKNKFSYKDCVHCGKCLTVCPSYNLKLSEFYSPRGRLRLILTKDQKVGELNNKIIGKSLSTCLLCGRCQRICPNGVSPKDLVINEKIMSAGNRAWLSKDKLALAVLKSDNKLLMPSALKLADILHFREITRRFSPVPEGRPFAYPEDLEFMPLAGDVQSEKKSSVGLREIRVGYFSGCVFRNIYPGISEDTITSLIHNGIKVYVPAKQGCCGLPFLSGGDMNSFRKLVLENVSAFKGKQLDYIVTSCASCSYSINKLYPDYFNPKDENYKDILDFSSKLHDIWHFFKLLEKNGVKVKEGKLKHEESAVFHIPCHLLPGEDFRPSSADEEKIGEPGFISGKVENLNIKHLKHNYCCGNGGTFNLRHYELSKKITRKKFEEIKEASPSSILTSCSGCMLSLKDQGGIFENGREIPVKHLISLYAESLKN